MFHCCVYVSLCSRSLVTILHQWGLKINVQQKVPFWNCQWIKTKQQQSSLQILLATWRLSLASRLGKIFRIMVLECTKKCVFACFSRDVVAVGWASQSKLLGFAHLLCNLFHWIALISIERLLLLSYVRFFNNLKVI